MTRRATFFLAIAIAAPLLALAFAWSFAPPILNTDSATGFLAWESMRDGGPWNSRLAPHPGDIAKDQPEFVTWWSPGQYVFPGLIHLTGLTWCHAALLATIASVLIGVFAVWRLGRRLGLDHDQAALACLLVSMAGGALRGFGMFWGGDILLLAAAPLVYLSALRIRDLPPFRGGLMFFAACLLALFCKHGAAVVMAGALLFLAAESFVERGFRFLRNPRIWCAIGAAVLAYICSNLLWIRGGPTPGDAGQMEHSFLGGLAFALNGPWLAVTGAGSIATWFFQRAGLEAAEGWHRFSGWLLLPGIVTTSLVLWLGTRREGDSARAWRLAACAWIATAGILSFLYLRGASVSLDDRHLRPAVAPLAVAVALAALPVAGARRLPRFVAAGFILAALVVGVTSHLRRVHLLAAMPRGTVTGFTQPDMSGDARDLVARAVPTGATLILINPSQALEFPDHRRLVNDAFFRSASELSRWRYLGTPPTAGLVLAIPAKFDADGRGAILRKAFVDVPPVAWSLIVAADWHLWLATHTANNREQP